MLLNSAKKASLNRLSIALENSRCLLKKLVPKNSFPDSYFYDELPLSVAYQSFRLNTFNIRLVSGSVCREGQLSGKSAKNARSAGLR